MVRNRFNFALRGNREKSVVALFSWFDSCGLRCILDWLQIADQD
jgi:hypothetical protein